VLLDAKKAGLSGIPLGKMTNDFQRPILSAQFFAGTMDVGRHLACSNFRQRVSGSNFTRSVNIKGCLNPLILGPAELLLYNKSECLSINEGQRPIIRPSAIAPFLNGT
jgi:hypothetical protein